MALTDELPGTLTLILAGGQGERLKPLTLHRAKPAVPFGGAYRIIDFTLSNCIHSGLRRIYVLTQYQARSLEEHIRFGWNFLPRRLEQFISPRPPHHQGTEQWYRGTADAIYHNIDTLLEEHPKHVLILSGDHIYHMDYGRMLREHVDHGAALTIGAVRIPASESRRFGVLGTDTERRVVAFQEKPEQGPEIPGQPGWCLGSMGIYIFNTAELIRRLREDAELADASSHDFGKDIIPHMIGEVGVFAHHYMDRFGGEPYWRDVGTIDAFYDANMDLVSVQPKLNLYDGTWPTYTHWHNNPPAKTIDPRGELAKTEVANSLLASGTVVSGGRIARSILSPRVRVEPGACVEDSIVFAGVEIGEGARIRKAILDKWTKVPAGMEIGYDRARDEERFVVTESGIAVVPIRYWS